MDFTLRLLQWYKVNHRNLPWRDTTDPYKIWLSEIILQQTRIAQGTSYYFRFLELFPNVHSLARASEDKVLGAWQGLGYYSRARNLHHTARVVANEYDGVFPADYKLLLELKGIGPYTAAAIASIAFGLPRAAIDGNVTRVIARYFGIEDPVDDTLIKKTIEETAAELLPPQQPGNFNQAMMDFGAIICKPGKPHCNICPFAEECIARKNGLISKIPLKSKKVKQKLRHFHFFLFYWPENEPEYLLIEKRKGNDIWKNLYQLPLIETQTPQLEWQLFEKHPVVSNIFHQDPNLLIKGTPERFIHQLTHQRIEAFFYKISLPPEYYSIFEKDFMKIRFGDFAHMGKPVLINRFLQKNGFVHKDD
ncbi:MAG: A/G-specific adenine glycosylase [Bacteroidetes bacterium]|nr:MAG: A/G-specific adenine glycosylase [Bacteroidota bacterium]